MENTMMKPKILALLTFGRQQEQQFVESLSEAERNATGTLENWAAKDFLGNILYWKQLQTKKLAMAVRGEVPPVWRDMKVIHRLNREAFLYYQDLSFQEILCEGDRVYETFLTQ
ncbi:MAG TPA: hypothetical protein VFN35_21845, partial [Ktedonobacteraceae bacterium]|nr:hypothetical protein [Ktedonobacteraceae bacterium]